LFRARQGAALEQKVSKGTADVGAAMKSGSKIRRSGSSPSNAGTYYQPASRTMPGFSEQWNRGDNPAGATPSRSTIDEIVKTPAGRAGVGVPIGHIR
jgi:hypothetical protein